MEKVDEKIRTLAELFKIIDSNRAGCKLWKNIPLAKEAFDRIRELPNTYKDELTPYIKIDVLEKMLDCTYELNTPRFSLKVREYQLSLFDITSEEDIAINSDDGIVTQKHVLEQIKQLRDYINTEISVDNYCKMYSKHLKFDNVERTKEWEDAIYEVEKNVDEIIGSEYYMGLCYKIWSVQKDILAQKGIAWNSPAEMNPRVLFD